MQRIILVLKSKNLFCYPYYQLKSSFRFSWRPWMLPGLPHSQAGSYDPLHLEMCSINVLLCFLKSVVFSELSDTFITWSDTHGATVFEVQRRQRETAAWPKERWTITRNTDGPNIFLWICLCVLLFLSLLNPSLASQAHARARNKQQLGTLGLEIAGDWMALKQASAQALFIKWSLHWPTGLKTNPTFWPRVINWALGMQVHVELKKQSVAGPIIN